MNSMYEKHKVLTDDWHVTMRQAIIAYDSLGDDIPKADKDVIWNALVIGLNLVQNEIHRVEELRV
jgi:hypothetical protein